MQSTRGNVLQSRGGFPIIPRISESNSLAAMGQQDSRPQQTGVHRKKKIQLRSTSEEKSE